MGTSSKTNDEFKFSMMSEFDMKDLNSLEYCLGMEFHQSEDKFFICETNYVKDMFNKFDMLDCKPNPTPIVHAVVLCIQDGIEMDDDATYKSIVGSLMFLTHTRPNISYLVSIVSRYMTKP